MSVYDKKAIGEWQSLLDRVYKETKMTAGVTDTENAILLTSGKRNDLCAKIRSIPESASYICNKSQLAMAGEARVTQKPVVEICEAGMAKMVVPVFNDEKYLGSVTACGGCFKGEEVDTFVISKNTEMAEEEIEKLIPCVPAVDEDNLSFYAARLLLELKES